MQRRFIQLFRLPAHLPINGDVVLDVVAVYMNAAREALME